MRLPAGWYPVIANVCYVSFAVFLVSFFYSGWCYTRLYGLLSRYGSSIIPDVYDSARLNPNIPQYGYKRSPLIRYVQKKQFEKEARPDIREAGRRAYKGQMITWWIVLPAFIVTAFLWIYFIQPR